MNTGRWWAVALLVVAAVTGAGFALQRHDTATLRREIELLREERQSLLRAKAENDRLKAAQLPASEIERLRADHAALVRLRAEIEELKKRTGGVAGAK